MKVYAVPIKVGLIIFPVIALLLTIPYMIRQYHKYGSIPLLRSVIVYSFVLYLLIAWFMVILPLPSIDEVSKMTGPWAQLVPFNFIKDITESVHLNLFDIHSWIAALKSSSVYTVLFNFVLTLPFGVYLRYYFNRKWWEVLTMSFMLSLFFEVTQLSCLFGIYPRPYRLFDVDDLIVNTTGGMLGYLITPLFSKILPSREDLDAKAYTKGERVSMPRRLIADLIDFIFVSLLTFFSVLTNDSLDLSILLLIYITYFIVLTMICGKTLGKFVVGIKVVNNDGKRAMPHQILIRYVTKYILYYEIFYVIFNMDNLSKLGDTGIFISIVLLVTLMFIYFKTIINAFNKKAPLVYEQFSKTKHISTIKNKYKEKEEKKKDE